jgi:hypothetical protein
MTAIFFVTDRFFSQLYLVITILNGTQSTPSLLQIVRSNKALLIVYVICIVRYLQTTVWGSMSTDTRLND